MNHATVSVLPSSAQLPHLVDQFLAGFVSANTRNRYAHGLRSLLAFSGAARPEQITDNTVQRWIAATDAANNTLRSNITAARSFLHWCADNGAATVCSDRTFRRLLKSIPQTYGRAQAKNPARWLDHSEAFGTLVTSCADGTEQGLSDEVIIRLLLSGMRCDEVTTLTVRNLRDLPTLHWMGKGRKQRDTELSPSTVDAFARYLTAYRDTLGRGLSDDDPLFCKANNRHTISFGKPIRSGNTIWHRVTTRARKAGLGHVAPHDLRRSTAKILWDARTPDGGMIFDVEKIRRILGHQSCETTQRYLDQIDRSVQKQAAQILG